MLLLIERLLQALGALTLIVIAFALGIVGYLINESQAPAPERTPDNYMATFTLDFENAEEERMIHLAEAAYPPRDAVVALAVLDDNGVPVEEIPETEAWWYASEEGIRIPYAVTAGAIEYYEGLIAQYKADPAQAPWNRASSNYSATVEYHTTLEKQGAVLTDVYVVKMTLDWSCTGKIVDSEKAQPKSTMSCFGTGSYPAVCFSKQRTVILKSTGEVLNIFGDERTEGCPVPKEKDATAARARSAHRASGGRPHV